MTRILAILAWALVALALAFPAAAQQRKNINALTAAELAALRTGFRVMASRNNCPRDSTCYRTSLEFWANAHRHFGSDCEGPVPANLNMGGIRARTASNQAERDVWCQCEHGSGRFLTWHRMFVWHFEQVLIAASGMPSLRLPYWDGTTLPEAFRSATVNGQPNPLYRANRAMNGGQAMSAAIRSSANAFSATTYATFNQRLEASPHGAIHCAIAGGCPRGYMGNAASAAMDPIFWLHHSEIDRLFEAWLRRGGQRPTTDLGRVYRFVTPAGSRTSGPVGDWLTLRTPYDRYPAIQNNRMMAEGAIPKPRTIRVTLLHDPDPAATIIVVHVGPDGRRTDIGVIDGFATAMQDTHTAERGGDFDATGLVGSRIEFEATSGLEGDRRRSGVIASVR